MKTNLYVIYDSKSELYNTPFALLNDEVAMRSAQQLLADPHSDIAKNPEDYSLFKIGTYDDANAIILELEKGMEVICRFHQLKAPESITLTEKVRHLEDQLANLLEQKANG